MMLPAPIRPGVRRQRYHTIAAVTSQVRDTIRRGAQRLIMVSTPSLLSPLQLTRAFYPRLPCLFATLAY